MNIGLKGRFADIAGFIGRASGEEEDPKGPC